MTMASRKRKQASVDPQNKRTRLEHDEQRAKDSTEGSGALIIEAQETHILLGKPGLSQAVSSRDQPGSSRGGLIRWTGDAQDEEVWADRYDALHLLSAIPLSIKNQSNEAPKAPPSPDETWEDLPSDTEDMFFFSPSEVESYRQKKRMDMFEKSRQERIRALEAEEAKQQKDDAEKGATGEVWGGSDEEPDEQELELMCRTANHIRSSANPGQLEMRILANHGANPKFAFLRGRWKRKWQDLMKPDEPKAGSSLIGTSISSGLVGYGSEEESGSDG